MIVRGMLGAIIFCVGWGTALGQSVQNLQFASVQSIQVVMPTGKLRVEAVPGAKDIQIRASSPASRSAHVSASQQEGVLLLEPLALDPGLEVIIRGGSKPLQIFLNEGEVSLTSWEAPAVISGHRIQALTQGTRGDLRLQSHAGRLRFLNHVGPLEVDTYGGAVEVSKVQGDVKLTNFIGSSQVQELVGSLAVDSYSGRVVVERSEGSLHMRGARAPVQISSHKGAIEGQVREGALVIELAEAAPSIRVESTTGPLQVRVPASIGAQVYVSSKQGALAVPRGVTTQKTAAGSVGWGRLPGSAGGRIHLKSETGDIRIR